MHSIRGSAFAAVLVLTSGLIDTTHGFFPQKWKEVMFGAGGVSHVEQTEIAFQDLATQYFPTIDHLTKGMIKARDTISQANADVDANFPHTAACHVDGESFLDAQDRLQTLKTEVITKLQQTEPDADGARKSLGSALHTIQDFYAHSNWVEMGNSAPHDMLGRAGSFAFSGPSSQTCSECISSNILTVCNDCSANEAGFNTELTSGYYFGEDVAAPPVSPAFKCHHGKNTHKFQGNVSCPVLQLILI
jgi:Heterokaryon incompatibility protein Het-C